MSYFSDLMQGGVSVPLVPAMHEPAFASYSTAANLFLFNHAKQMIAELAPGQAGSEARAGGSFNANVGTVPSTNVPAGYACTGQVSMHGHVNIMLMPSVYLNSGAYSGSYAAAQHSQAGTYWNGAYNSRSTGVWANKARRDNLCLMRYISPDVGVGAGINALGNTLVSRLGWGAISSPISQSQIFSGGQNSFTTNRSFGLIGYNELTKTLVVANPGTSAASHTFYVYYNVSPATYQNLADDSFWNSTNIAHGSRQSTTFSFTAASDNLDWQHYKIIPLDNGNIRVVWRNGSSYVGTFLLTGNSGTTSTSWTKGADTTLTLTTSYHDSSKNFFDALTHFTTWDGKYTFVGGQYYYYDCGLIGFVIRHSDGLAYSIQWTDTSNAFQPVMIGANTMLVSSSANQDSAGTTCREVNFKMIYDQNLAAFTNISTYYTEGYVDCPLCSTSYGGIFQVNSPLPLYAKGGAI